MFTRVGRLTVSASIRDPLNSSLKVSSLTDLLSTASSIYRLPSLSINQGIYHARLPPMRRIVNVI